MKEIDEELISDMIPNSTLFDKGTNINKKVIYLFEQENKKYSCYSNENIIFINERIYEENNHIDERTIKVYLNEDNYIISRIVNSICSISNFFNWIFRISITYHSSNRFFSKMEF